MDMTIPIGKQAVKNFRSLQDIHMFGSYPRPLDNIHDVEAVQRRTYRHGAC